MNPDSQKEAKKKSFLLGDVTLSNTFWRDLQVNTR
jgi:hypothetical protein